MWKRIRVIVAAVCLANSATAGEPAGTICAQAAADLPGSTPVTVVESKKSRGALGPGERLCWNAAPGSHSVTFITSQSTSADIQVVDGETTEIAVSVHDGRVVAAQIASGQPSAEPATKSPKTDLADGIVDEPPASVPIGIATLAVGDDQGGLRHALSGGFRVRVAEQLRAQGVEVVGATGSVFEREAGSGARLLLGGTIKSAICGPLRCEVLVRWELFDQDANAVVYEFVSAGLVDRERRTAEDGARAALDSSVVRLSGREAFQNALSARSDATSYAAPTWSSSVQVARCTSPAAPMPSKTTAAQGTVGIIKSKHGSGSGVVISADGWLLTAAHVVADEQSVRVVLHNGMELPGSIVRIDHRLDVALLHLPVKGLPCTRAAPKRAVVGSSLYAIGSPLGEVLESTVTQGIVSGYRTEDELSYLQTDASINAGASGGPLLDDQGYLQGIITFKLAGVSIEGLGFGVPTDLVVERLGIEWAETSSSDLSTVQGSRGAPSASVDQKTVDTPDESTLTLGRTSSTRGSAMVPMSRRTTTQLWITSGVTTGTGVALVGGTLAWAKGVQRTQPTQWNSAVAVNTLGWLLAVGGASGLIALTAMPKGKTSVGVGTIRGTF